MSNENPVLDHSLAVLDAPSRYFFPISVQCNEVNDAYNFNDSTSRIGHLVKLSFPSVKKELKADLSVCNPENPHIKDRIVGVIESCKWEGNPNDDLRLTAKISFENKATLQEALSLLSDNPIIEAEFVIYEYDYNEKKHFQGVHTFKKPIQFTLKQSSVVYISEDPYNFNVRKPINFLFEIYLTPINGAPQQKIGLAFRSNGTQIARQIGGPL